MGDKKELITIAMNLVRDHYDGNETQFGSSCSELEEWCYDHGKEGCAEYVMAQRSPALSFVPMEGRNVHDATANCKKPDSLQDSIKKLEALVKDIYADYWTAYYSGVGEDYDKDNLAEIERRMKELGIKVVDA